MVAGGAARASSVKVVQPGEGRAGVLSPGVEVVFKVDGADSGGALAIVEHPFAVGALVPPHVHTREDEFSIVLEGKMGFRSEDQEVVLDPGGYIVKPRGEVHAMWNAGDVPARMIEVISPSGFDDFFRGVTELTADGPPDMGAVMALATEHELVPANPAWLPDVIERYGLVPPPM